MVSIRISKRQYRRLSFLPRKSPRYFTRKRRIRRRRQKLKPLKLSQTLLDIETVTDPATGFLMQRCSWANGRESWEIVYGVAKPTTNFPLAFSALSK